ncbi:MAG: hypothetical protein GX878_11605 [Firmicutes bacterium]|nr:hypothetical protein [Bacillota bacterium]
MDETALKKMLLSTKFPVAYAHYTSPPKLPYLIYYLDRSRNFGADDQVYAQAADYIIELYCDKRDPKREAQIEKLLNDNGIYWEKTGTWIQSERFYLTAYYI